MDYRDTVRINIAIDGPAGAGKSTVARFVARQLRYIYIDTGSMYRAVTLRALEADLTPDREDEIAVLAEKMEIALLPGEEGQRVIVDGEDVTEKLRTLEVNRMVSYVAKIEGVRYRMSRLQREMAKEKGVVMDGRDIGTHVLPDAELKVFLTASPLERAQRRFREMGERPGVTLGELERDIAERDRIDREREIAPLVQAKDARLLDSTGKTAEQVASEIVEWGLAAIRTLSPEGK